jgi:hypothetical protein
LANEEEEDAVIVKDTIEIRNNTSKDIVLSIQDVGDVILIEPGNRVSFNPACDFLVKVQQEEKAEPAK